MLFSSLFDIEALSTEVGFLFLRSFWNQSSKKMKVWVIFILIAYSVAEEYRDESRNMNDLEIYDLEDRPIFPFDFFNLGYDHFLRKAHPPLISAMNSDATYRVEAGDTETASASTTDSVSKSSSASDESYSSETISESFSASDQSESWSSASISVSEIRESSSAKSSGSVSKTNLSDSRSNGESTSSQTRSQTEAEVSTEKSFEEESTTSSIEPLPKQESRQSEQMELEKSLSRDEGMERKSETSATPETEMSADLVTVEEYSDDTYLSLQPSCIDKPPLDDIKEEIKKAYTGLDALRKRLHKKDDVAYELNEILKNLERLCDEICSIVPPEFLAR